VSVAHPEARGDASARFWAHAATFGALWGALEATVGSFLHAVRVPFGGTLLAASGAALLLSLRVVHPRRGVMLAAGAVCAFVKMVAPSTSVLGPMVGILVESALIELACLPFADLGRKGPSAASAALGGALATIWSLSQKVLVQVVLFGAPIVAWYADLLARAEAWLGLPRAGGLWVAGPFVALVAALGAGAALVGLRAGRAARARAIAPSTGAPGRVAGDPA
jgi:hypothetical protein